MGEQAVVVATLVTDKVVRNIGIPPVDPGGAFTLLKTHSEQSSSSSIQIINGKASQRNEITTRFYYFIAPRQTGTFVFPSLSVNVEGTVYRTEPLAFTVTDQPVTNPDVRAFLTISAKTLYTGEQAVLTFKAAQRAQAQGSTDLRNGFNAALESIEKSFGSRFSLTRLFKNQVTTGSERIDGELYNVYSLRFLLFPLNTGTVSIQPIPFEYQELRRTRRRSISPFFDDFFGDDFFGGGIQAVPKTVFTNPLTIEVKPLPPPPAGFSGAVGSFSIKASADPQSVPAGDAVTLKVILKGNSRPANMGDISIPQSDEYEIFTPEKQVVVDTTESGFSTKKTYKYLLIPKNEGTLTLAPIVFSYFDPKSSSYKTASSEPIVITVTKGKAEKKEQTRYLTQEEIREVGRDIRYIKTGVSLKHRSRYPYRNPVLFLLFPLPLLFFAFTLLYRFQSVRKERNVAVQLRNRALAEVQKQLKQIRKQGKALKPNEYLGRIAGIIENYISHKFGFPATGRTLEELKEELLRSTSDEKTVSDLTLFIEKLDEYRFGGKSLDETSREAILNHTFDFISGLEKTVKKRGKS